MPNDPSIAPPPPAQLPGLDLLKFSMAIAVVGLHSWLFSNVPCLHALVHPLYLVAVPVFFTVSAYLFFTKVERTAGKGDWSVLGHYVKRLAIFYLFWFTVMLPVTVVAQQWHRHFGVAGFCRDLFLGSTFRGSWFIAALLFGMPCVFAMRKVLGSAVVLFLALAIHLAFQVPLEGYFPVFQWIGRYAFPSSMVWMALGAWLAEVPPAKARPEALPARGLSPQFPVFRWMALLAIYGAMVAIDPVDIASPLSLLKPILRLAFTSLIFALALECRTGNAALCRKLRQLSILVYVTHFAFAYATAFAREKYPVFGNGFVRFPIVLGGALTVSFLFLHLKNKRLFSWLKWGL